MPAIVDKESKHRHLRASEDVLISAQSVTAANDIGVSG
jgi:hypothetical protein